MMKIDALRRADALMARTTGTMRALEAPLDGPAPSRAGEAGTQQPEGAGVGVGHQANGTDDPRGSERPWWRRVFGG